MRTLIAVLALLLRGALGQDLGDMYCKAEAARMAGNVVEAESILDVIAAEIETGKPNLITWALPVIGQYTDLGRPAKANSVYRSALKASHRQQSVDKTEGLLLWKGSAAWKQGLYADAETALHELLVLYETHTHERSASQLDFVLGLLANTEEALGRLKEAEDLFVRQGNLPRYTDTLPPCAVSAELAPGTFLYPNDLGDFYEAHGHLEKAEDLYRRLVKESSNRSIAEKYWALGNLSFFLYRHKRLDEVAIINESQIAILLSSPEASERDCGHMLRRDTARLEIQGGQFAAAEATIEKAVIEARKDGGTAGQPYIRALLLHVSLALGKADYTAAEKALGTSREAAARSESKTAKSSFNFDRLDVVASCRRAARFDLAKKLIDEHVADTVQWFGKDGFEYLKALDTLLDLAMEQKDYATAGKWVDDYIDTARKYSAEYQASRGLKWKAEISAQSKR